MNGIIKDHPCSKLWKDGGYIYKWQPKFLTENELWCFAKLFPFGFVPAVERVELEVIRTTFIEDEPPTNTEQLLRNVVNILEVLLNVGIRHGDLTRPNIVISRNKPILLDFAESRLTSDPRRDKRPEGDEYWLRRTIEEIINGRA